MSVEPDQLLHTLTTVANALAAQQVPFAVAGGLAVYARGGPMTEHDVDIFVKPADVTETGQVLAAAGLRSVDPPENWLTKFYDGKVLVDVIFRPSYRIVDDDLLGRASWLRIGPTSALVISGTDLLVDKLMVLDGHRLDFSQLLRIARDLREQVDWAQVRELTEASPYARAFLGLLDDLAITGAGAPNRATDAVLPEYVVAHLRRAFAEDPRTAELGIDIGVTGDTVVVTGDVTTTACRDDLETILHEQVPSLKVRNDVRVTAPKAPDHAEDLH